jgi:hypothetical protein
MTAAKVTQQAVEILYTSSATPSARVTSQCVEVLHKRYVGGPGDNYADIPQGVLTLTGYAPTFIDGYSTFNIPQGVLTLTGYAPTFSDGNEKTFDIPQGTLTLTGYAPTFEVSDYNVSSIPQGTLTLTGYAPTFSVRKISEFQATSQHALNAYKTSQFKGVSQHTLSRYVTSAFKGTSQHALAGWITYSFKGNYQNALEVFETSQFKSTSQHAILVYQTSAFKGTSQHALSVYATSQFSGSSLHSLNAYEQQQFQGNAQWILDAAQKYYGYALNLKTGALSKLDDFKFNSFSGNLGADENGIYTLTGTTNDGVAIPAFIETGTMDFKWIDKFQYANLKRIVDAYIAKSGGALKLTVTTENSSVVYNIASNSQLETVKANLARGAKGRYWKFKIENIAGSSFELDSLELNAEVIQRRV